jgi:hypothetical protein
VREPNRAGTVVTSEELRMEELYSCALKLQLGHPVIVAILNFATTNISTLGSISCEERKKKLNCTSVKAGRKKLVAALAGTIMQKFTGVTVNLYIYI